MQYTRKVHYYETDQMGIVHHSNYIRWFEEARLQLLEDYDFSYSRLEELGVMSAVIGVNAEYKSMVRFGETVNIKITSLEYTGILFKLGYTVTDAADGTLRCKGTTTHCFINSEGRPVRLKRSFPEVHALFFRLHEENKECE